MVCIVLLFFFLIAIRNLLSGYPSYLRLVSFCIRGVRWCFCSTLLYGSKLLCLTVYLAYISNQITFVLRRSRVLVFPVCHTAILCNKIPFITCGWINKIYRHITFADRTLLLWTDIRTI